MIFMLLKGHELSHDEITCVVVALLRAANLLVLAFSDFHVPSEYLTNIHIRDKVTVSFTTVPQYVLR